MKTFFCAWPGPLAVRKTRFWRKDKINYAIKDVKQLSQYDYDGVVYCTLDRYSSNWLWHRRKPETCGDNHFAIDLAY
jgi:hypothetical protein